MSGKTPAAKCAQSRAYRKRHPQRVLNALYLKKYGITLAQYEQLSEAQGGRCSICDQKPEGRGPAGKLHVDHCHATKRVRGLLCNNCNNGLGRFKHSAKFLERAAFYLSEPSPLEAVA